MVVVLKSAGWHGGRPLQVQANVVALALTNEVLDQLKII